MTDLPNNIQYNSYLRGETMIYDDPTENSGIFRAILEENIEELNMFKQTEYAFNTIDEYGNTPLHVAVIGNKLSIVNYLLEQDEVSVNAKNMVGQTPMYNASRTGKLKIIEELIKEGAEVNTQDCMGNTPLHFAVSYPRIVEFLIQNGADVDATNFDSDTPIHNAVTVEDVESVCTLLYYNCDTSVKNANCNTPFMDALIYENVAIQDALFEYVDDFNESSSDDDTILTLALTYQSPYVEEILSRGAKVNRRALESALMINHYGIFETIWKKLPCEELESSILLDKFAYGLRRNNILKYIDIVLENSDDAVLEMLANCFNCQLSYVDFVETCAHKRGLNQFTQLTSVLLQYNCIFFLPVVYDIYVYFGYCDMFKYFLYINQVEQIETFGHLGWIIPKYIYNIKSDLKSICEELNCNWFLPEVHVDLVLKLLEFSVNSHLVNLIKKYSNNEKCLRICEIVPAVPSLLELAREQTRKYIVNRFNFSTASQYYTFINSIDINNVYKRILRWEKPIYSYSIR